MAKTKVVFPTSYYMVIDTTKVEETKIKFVAENERATLLGRLYKAEHPGRTCIAPPVEGRGFSKLDKLALQYLFWNTFGKTPNEDYQILLKEALEETLKLEVNQSEISILQASLAEFGDLGPSGAPVPKKEPKPKAEKTGLEVPKATSTCGVVWDIAEKMFIANGNVIPERKAFIDACVEEGLHPATASTQFAKWKKTKAVVQ